MKIVALRGKGGTGKSTALKTFLLRLLKEYHITTVNYENGKTFTSEDLEKEIAKENLLLLSSSAGAQDYIVKFEIKGVKYGVTTHGDNRRLLEKGFEKLSDCEVVFCAVRTSGDGLEYLRSKESAQVLIVNKTSLAWQLSLLKNPLEVVNYTNEKQAEILFEIFKNL